MPRILPALLLLLAAAVSGCTMAPTYRRPDAPIPNVWRSGNGTASAPLMQWKEFFKDPNVQRVVGTALENNRDLRVAMLNIERTRNLYRIQRADILPTINASAGESMQHLPADLSGTGQQAFQRSYSAGLGFSSFELDLFGRIRSLSDKALETYYSVENDAETARLSLIAETAAMYLQLIADRELLDLTQGTFNARRQQYELIARKFQAGVASELERSQARSIMEEARSNLARYKTRVEQDENALALLMGAPLPADLPNVRRLADITSLADVPEGLPSALLERRPDIRSAEHLLTAANADIGAARANFFPRISLTGNIGTISTEFNELFSGSAGTWSFLPSITLPLFDTGRNIARLRVSETEKEIAVAQYEKAIQSAFREVADALSQRAHIGEQLSAEEALVRAGKTSYDLSSLRYNAGVDSYLNVLDAERSYYSAQQSYIAARLLRESNALELYKALGGGWESNEK